MVVKVILFLLLGVVVNAITYECSNANLNIRSGAGTTYSINWVSNSGDKFQVLSTNGVWHQVKAASGSRCGQTGWAHSDYLISCSGAGDCNGGTPTPPPPPSSSWVTPTDALNIRSGASTSNAVQWVAQPGEVFQVLSNSNGWSYLKAASGSNCGRTGYASAQFLTASGSSSCSATPPPPSPPSTSFPLYKQCDSRWGQNPLGNYGGETVCSAGCAMSSVAMALTRYGATYTPGTLNDWLKTHGGYASGNLIYWDAVRPLGLTAAMVGLDVNGLSNAVAAGKPVVVNVRNGGHWVLVTGNAGGGNFYVNDPGYSSTTYAFSSMSHFVVYTPVARVQSVRAGAGSTDDNNESSADETSTQVIHDRQGHVLRIVQHDMDGTEITDEYPETGEIAQDALATLNAQARQRLRQQGKGHLLLPVNASKPKNGPGKVNASKPKNGPGRVQASKPKNGPGRVQASKPKNGPAH